MGSRVSTINDWLQIKIGGEDEITKKKKGPRHPNRVKSTKYTLITFLPQNLLEQFRRIANFYFLVMTIISLLIDSPVSPMTSLLPLVFVIAVTAAKQGYEDFLRYKTDNIVNRSAVTVLRNGQEMHIESQDVAPGDLVVVERDCDVPCDLVLLRTTDPHGKCFITTANLDGESNLKTLMVPRDLPIVDPNKLHKLGVIECENAKTDLYSFNGKIELAGGEGRILPLTAENVLLRGSRVKNTECVIGCAVYVGMNTKLQLNSRLTRNKTASSEVYINRFLIFVLIAMIGMVTLMYFLKRYDELYVVPNFIYLGPPADGYSVKQFLQDYLSFLILFNYLIPISLYVTIEMTRVFGGLFMEWDTQLYDEDTDEHCIVNTSNLNEELGQINILFSDKTGTLTKNEMIFQQCSIGGRKFLYKKTRLQDMETQALLDINKFNSEQKGFFQALAICHTVQVAKDQNATEEAPTERPANGDKNATPLGLAKMYSMNDIAEESQSSGQPSANNLADDNNSTVYDSAQSNPASALASPNDSTTTTTPATPKSKRRQQAFRLASADTRIHTVNEDDVDSETIAEVESGVIPKVTNYQMPQEQATIDIDPSTTRDANPLLNDAGKKRITVVRSQSNQNRVRPMSNNGFGVVGDGQQSAPRMRPVSLQFRRTHSDIELNEYESATSTSLGHRRSQSYGAPVTLRRDSGNSEDVVVSRSSSMLRQEDIVGMRESYAAPSFQRQPTLLLRAESTRRKNEIAQTVQMLDYQASSPDEKALVEASANLGLVYLGDDDEVLKVRVIPPHLDKMRPFRIGQNVELSFTRLHVLEFTSDRKRMSVVVQDENGEKWIYTKGAESYVFPLCSQASNDMVTKTDGHISEFARQGLRTLAIARRRIDENEYRDFVKGLNEANSSLENRKEMSAKCYAKIETELTLLGATAVEDALQDNVSDTLVSLQAAGIRIWVLTGDKVETALNIALSCGHIPQNAFKYFIIDCTNREDMLLHLNALEREIHLNGGNKPTSLLIDGPSLTIALTETPTEFRNISIKCTAVLCCRLSPLQKSEVVALIKTSPENFNTAAIGDGANDVSMIQEAHVGIGIMGKEGRQAARCADFAFAKFCLLKRLILVHGHYHSTRLSYLVLYFFYKNIVFMGIMFLFQFYTLYSSVSVYDSLFLTLFNVIYTSVPILFISLTEKPHKEEVLMHQPELYQQNTNNKQLHWQYFLGWTVNAIFHSVIIFYFGYLVFNTNDVILNVGQTAAFSSFGTLMMQMVVIVVNLKLLTSSKYLTYWYLVTVIGSILAFVITTVIYNVINFQYDTDIYWAYNKLLSSLPVWFFVILTTIACLLPDFTVSIASKGVRLPKRSFFPGNERMRRLKLHRNKVHSTQL